jgi:hypothetical protein
MKSLEVKRLLVGPVLALASLALVLPFASQAATSPNTTPGPPRVSTGGTTRVSGTSATLQGSINPRTLTTTYYFQYGPTTTYGQQTPAATLTAGTTLVKVSQPVTGLLPGYHYRLVASNSEGQRSGHDRTFSLESSKKTAFELPKTYKATPRGGTFLLSGTLTGTGGANRQIVLQATPYPYTTAYTDVGIPIVTTATGHFTFVVAHLDTGTKFRIATVSTKPIYSLVVPAQVSVRVALKVRTSPISKGLVRLYGTVTPAEVGAHVYFELEKAPKSEEGPPTSEKPARLENPAKNKGKSEHEEEKGPAFLTKFSTVVKPGTKSLSRFSAIVSIRISGHYRAFVDVLPGPLASGHSSTVLLHAAPSDGKKRKKKKG